MKYIIILIAFMANGCGYGMYPRTQICNGEIVSYYCNCDSLIIKIYEK